MPVSGKCCNQYQLNIQHYRSRKAHSEKPAKSLRNSGLAQYFVSKKLESSLRSRTFSPLIILFRTIELGLKLLSNLETTCGPISLLTSRGLSKVAVRVSRMLKLWYSCILKDLADAISQQRQLVSFKYALSTQLSLPSPTMTHVMCR